MLTQKRRKLLTMAGATAVLGCGLALSSQTASFAGTSAAQAVTITVTPSTGLEDGTEVQIGASGFPADDQLTAGQCADIDGKTACNEDNRQNFAADAEGNGSATMIVNRAFEGVYVDGSGSAGTVDCGTAACFIGVGNFAGDGGAVPISFA